MSWDYLLTNNDEHVPDFAVCQLKAIIGALHVENAESMKCLSVTLSPSTSRCAQAASAIKRGALKPAPVATSILPTSSENPKLRYVPDWTLATHNSLAFSGGRTGTLYIVPKHPVKTIEGKKPSEFIAPLWVVKATQDTSAANMQIQIEEIDVGEGKCVYVPMMFNTRVIKKGEELLLHQRRGCVSRWPIADKVLEPPAKQAKTTA